MEKTLILMQGIPGSGKSTVAQGIADAQHGFVYSTDSFWFRDDASVYAFDPKRLVEAHAWNQDRVKMAMERGESPVIVDNTNIFRSHVASYREMAEAHGYVVSVVRVDTPVDECIRRNALRSEDRRIPVERIREMRAAMEDLL